MFSISFRVHRQPHILSFTYIDDRQTYPRIKKKNRYHCCQKAFLFWAIVCWIVKTELKLCRSSVWLFSLQTLGSYSFFELLSRPDLLASLQCRLPPKLLHLDVFLINKIRSTLVSHVEVFIPLDRELRAKDAGHGGVRKWIQTRYSMWSDLDSFDCILPIHLSKI